MPSSRFQVSGVRWVFWEEYRGRRGGVEGAREGVEDEGTGSNFEAGTSGAGLWLTLAAGAMAFAVLTRWAYALVAIPATVYALVMLWRRPRREAMLHGLIAAVAVMLVLWPLWKPLFSHLFVAGGGDAAFVGDLQVYSWHPLNAFRREFVTADGLLRYRFPNGVYYLLAPLHRFYFTALAAPFLLAGAWRAARMRSLAWLLLVLGWVAAILLFHAGAAWQNFRFTLAALPPLALLVALAAQGLYESGGWVHSGTIPKASAASVDDDSSIFTQIGRNTNGERKNLKNPMCVFPYLRLFFSKAERNAKNAMRPLLLIYLAVMLLLMAWGGARLTQSFIQRKEDDLATVAWVESRLPEDGRLLTFGLTATFQHYTDVETHELFYLNPTRLTALLEEGRPLFIFVDERVLETQWRGRPPETNVHWLRERASLKRLDGKGNYTLFVVELVGPP